MPDRFQVGLRDFINEVQRWNVTQKGMLRIELEEIEDSLVFYFSIPNLNKTYFTVIKKSELSDADRMNLLPISIPAVRNSPETEAIISIKNKLIELEEELKKIPENANITPHP